MGIFIGDTEPSKIFVGGSEVASVWAGDTKVRPVIKDVYVDFLLIGGGGGGSGATTYGVGGGGGGAGGVVNCCNYFLQKGNYNIVIGEGGKGDDQPYRYSGYNGCNSCFNDIVAYGGGAGGGLCQWGYDGGSGGGGGTHCGRAGGNCCPGQGNKGGKGTESYAGGGGGGAGGCGQDGYYCSSVSRTCPGKGGIGIQSDITGTTQRYAGGGSGFSCTAYGEGRVAASCGGTASGNYNGSNATKCGAGGGAFYCHCCNYGKGGNGIFVLRYPTDCGYKVTGGCKYTCGNYTIHCFTSNGTLTVN